MPRLRRPKTYAERHQQPHDEEPTKNHRRLQTSVVLLFGSWHARSSWMYGRALPATMRTPEWSAGLPHS